MKMKSPSRYTILFPLLLIAASCNINRKPAPVCRVEYDRIIYTIDDRWSDQYKKDIFLQFELDSTTFAQAFQDRKTFTRNNETWKIKRVNTHILELSRPIGNRTDSLIVNGHVLMFTGGPGWLNGQLPDNCGVNL